MNKTRIGKLPKLIVLFFIAFCFLSTTKTQPLKEQKLNGAWRVCTSICNYEGDTPLTGLQTIKLNRIKEDSCNNNCNWTIFTFSTSETLKLLTIECSKGCKTTAASVYTSQQNILWSLNKNLLELDFGISQLKYSIALKKGKLCLTLLS
jgi:hypothetical protein